jgi:pilus assembly protein CpaE
MAIKILAVDDDALNLKLVSATLSRDGYEVLMASNGMEAIHVAETDSPDLILMDVMMPEMDGYEACKQLRMKASTARIPIMMLTALSTVEEKIKGFDAGADDYLAKPYAADELLAHVKVLLRRATPVSTDRAQVSAKVNAVFSLRGGIGVSTLATNLAAGFTALWNQPVVLIDLSLNSGQGALMFNLPYRNSWADLVGIPANDIDEMVVMNILLNHESGTRVLAAPLHPEDCDGLGGETVEQVIRLLSNQYDYLVLDLPHDFSETTLAGLDSADEILLVLAPELASVRAAIGAIRVFESLGYPNEKIRLVLNWTFQRGGLSKKEIEAALKRPIDFVLPYASEALVAAINLGKPPVIGEPNQPLSNLFEDMTFYLSKNEHRKKRPSAPTPAWQRVAHRIQQRRQK